MASVPFQNALAMTTLLMMFSSLYQTLLVLYTGTCASATAFATSSLACCCVSKHLRSRDSSLPSMGEPASMCFRFGLGFRGC